ncbi:divalent-cation tolerance protein CutA [Candidatus Margulisiibacteriota bacterium]
MKFNLVYITCKNKGEADKIGNHLVEDRLAAGVNIINGVNSIYWWQDKVQAGQEAILIAKTKEALVPELIAKVKSLHSYAVPCVVSLPITDGNPDFLDWIQKETK